MTRLPLILTLLRLIAGISFVPLAYYHPRPGVLIALLVGGLLSDIADGIIARRLGVATLALRRLDTRVDLVFYVCAVVGAFMYSATSPVRFLPWLAAYLLLFLVRNLVDFVRYRASPSYHMWSGKIWSVLIFIHLIVLLTGGQGRWLWPLAFAFYAVNAMEGVVASLMLPLPCKDVPTLWHALQRRSSVSGAWGT